MLSDYFENFVFIEKRTISDGGGGFIEEWVEGAKFQCGITRDNSTEGKLAEQQGVKNLYTIVAPVNVPLKYNDIIKRTNDGATFRITSDSLDAKTPARARIKNQQFSAERYDLNTLKAI